MDSVQVGCVVFRSQPDNSGLLPAPKHSSSTPSTRFLVPPLQICTLKMGGTNMWWRGRAARPRSLQEHVIWRSQLRLVLGRRKWKSHSRWEWEEKWLRKELSWTEKPSLVASVWISWRIRWLSPVDTATVWSVLKPTGMERTRRESTAALSAGRLSQRGLTWRRTSC